MQTNSEAEVSSFSDSEDNLSDEFTYKYEQDTMQELKSDDENSDNPADIVPMMVIKPKVKILPFPAVSPQWYVMQNRLAKHNSTRDSVHQAIAVERDDDGAFASVNRSEVSGSLQENLTNLEVQMTSVSSKAKKTHLKAIIAVGNHIKSNGPTVNTQELGEIYMKEKEITKRCDSIALYDIFCKHLNISQVYLFGKAYIVLNQDNLHLNSAVASLKKVFDSNKEEILTKIAKERISHLFLPALRYMDTPRDKQVLKGLISQLTNISFTTRLQCVQNRNSTRRANRALPVVLGQYKQICTTSQMVRNDLTILQQYQLTQRLISQRKLKEIRVIAEGRGRKLKCTHFPELATVLAYAFGDYDVEQGGGGLEAHPRLTCGTLYQTSDSVTTMKRAREILLSVAPNGFSISLSTCYNYTENYRERSAQSKRHHAGRGVNAPISLGKPPRTGVQQLVINLHWSTANVNLIVDASQKLSQSIYSGIKGCQGDHSCRYITCPEAWSLMEV